MSLFLFIEAAKNNAKIYGVEDRIEFLVGDYFKIAPSLKPDVVFLSPPWGGPGFGKVGIFDIKTMLPLDGVKIFQTALEISNKIAYYLPKNTSEQQLRSLTGATGDDVHTIFKDNWITKRCIAKTAYFWPLVLKPHPEVKVIRNRFSIEYEL